MLWRLLLISFLSAGCAHRSNGRAVMPVPDPGTREALLPTYKPTGSACLDSISVNMLYAGCSSVRMAQSEDGITIYVGCVQSQPGAQDVFSKSTFIRTLSPNALPEGAEPFCGDPTGIYAMWHVPFSEIIQHE